MINKCILMGRLTKDPELRHTNSGVAVCSFSIAINSGYGENQTADYINCSAWRGTGEFVAKNFSKGKMIIVVGRISTRSWEGSDGKKNYATEVVAGEAAFGEGKKAEEASNENTSGGFIPVDDGDMPF